jgi:hypothetical protein
MTNSLPRDNPFSWVSDFERFAACSRINWIGQSDPHYEEARALYNRYHNLYPGALVRTLSPASIGGVIRFATDYNLPLAIRGGGHHIAGYGSCEGGIVIDFSPFRTVVINSAGGIIEVEPGARLGDVDRKLCPVGLVVPSGTVSDTGIAGLTLGGGIGWLVGRYGLTCDQLVGADLVLADGSLVRAEDPGHEDLLWALRGGGGNFGVVTRFRYKARALPFCVVGSATVCLRAAAATLTRAVDFLEASCPRNLTVAPILTRSADGEPLLSIDFCLAGGNDDVLSELSTAIGEAQWSIRRDGDYSRWQSSFDAIFQPPMRGYWKARYAEELTKGHIDELVGAMDSCPTRHSTILIEHLHGAFSDVDNESSAFPLRWARFGILLSARWHDPSQDHTCTTWVRESFARLDPLNNSATYSNYAGGDDSRALMTFDTSLTTRLCRVKTLYDPNNRFARNHNFPSLATQPPRPLR